MIREINYSDSSEMKEVYLLLVKAIPHAKIDIANSLHLLGDQDLMYKHIQESDLMDSKLFGFFIENELVGVCGLYSIDEDFSDTDWVNWFAVSEKYRLQGIAKKMFLFLEGEAKKRNKSFLKVYTTLPEMISFWLSFADYCDEEIDNNIQYYYFKKKL